jgi:hypothetical protein
MKPNSKGQATGGAGEMTAVSADLMQAVRKVANGESREVIVELEGLPPVRVSYLPQKAVENEDGLSAAVNAIKQAVAAANAPYESTALGVSRRRLGQAHGKFFVPEDIDAANAEIASMFEVGGLSGQA